MLKIKRASMFMIFIAGFAVATVTLFGGTNMATAASSVPVGFRDERVAGGASQPAQHQLTTPTAMGFLPDGRVLITEKGGKLRLLKNNMVEATPVIDLTSQVASNGDSGLIGVAVDPDFATNGHIYLAYTNLSPREGRVARFTMTDDMTASSTQSILLTTIADNASHMLNSVKIGPDGLLYASAGDSSPFDTATVGSTRAQQADKTVGKLFRMTREGKGLPNNPYWTGNANDAASKVMALGLRNPFRFTIQPDGEVIVGDVGWNSWEEINRIPATSGNRNYGWPCYEGNSGSSQTQPAFGNFPVCQSLLPQGTGAVTAPVYAYNHTVGSSVTGGPIYNGTAFPAAYQNAYFFGDYSKNWLNYWPRNAAGAFVGQPIRFGDIPGPVDIQNGPDGSLYYISITQGELRRISYNSSAQCADGSYLAKYYTNKTWTGTPALSRCDDSIDSNWGTGGPFGATPVDNYSIHWSGRQYFTKGSSLLSATSDDGTQVWVDGQLVIDNNAVQPATTKTATLTYPASGYHDVIVKYYEAAGQASAKFSITSTNKPPVPVIAAPVDGSTFAANQEFTVSGTATDPEDGTLTGDSLSWQTFLWHCPPVSDINDICHNHPYSASSGNTGTVTAPDTAGDWVYLEVRLTATDAEGATSTATAKVFPNFCSTGQYQGKYYKNNNWSGTPAITRCDTAINFDWAKGGPFGATPIDQYSADWHHPHYFPAGSSTLTITSDDGTQVWVDGKLLINNSAVQPATTKSAKVNFPKAGYHDVYIRYYEAAGFASAKFTVTQP